MNSKVFLAAASLIGTIIGAGVFAIPYVVSRSGVLIAFFYFILLSLVVLLLHLMYAEVVLRTNGQHQLIGYAKKYLGPQTKIWVLMATVFGTLGSLLVYIILAGEFFRIVIPGLSYQQGSLLFWLALSLFVLLGIESIAKLELVMSLAMLLIFSLIFVYCWPKVHLANYALFDFNYFFLPFGVLLFSMVGWNTVPDLIAILNKKKHLLPVVTVSFLLCVLVYILFGFLVAGVAGPNMGEKVFEALAPYFGPRAIVLGAILGLLAIATSFVISANYLKLVLQYDCRLPKMAAFLLASLIPLALFCTGINQFLVVVGIVGAFMGLAEGATIALVYQKAKQYGERIPEHFLLVPNIIIYGVLIILCLGTLVEVLNNLF
jgi:tyrosine-specific transport protein